MLIYKDGIVSDYRDVFPNTSFPPSGPSDEFLAEQGAYKVNVWLPHDLRTEKLVPCAPYLQDGWAYTVEVQAKTPEEIAAYDAALVPQTITPRQCRLELLNRGLLSQVEVMIAQQDEATRITWEYAVLFERRNPLLLALAESLDLASSDLDEFFMAASIL